VDPAAPLGLCRLFGLAAGREPVEATFGCSTAPDSLAKQSRRNPDGCGLATFAVDGRADARVEKRPVAAYEDEVFAREANERESPLFFAHVRYASTGKPAIDNAHPFEQEGRVFAQNGHLEGLEALDDHLGEYRRLVCGDTDSERFFALVTTATGMWALRDPDVHDLLMLERSQADRSSALRRRRRVQPDPRAFGRPRG
jgi:predicted glutamine amidotransferase